MAVADDLFVALSTSGTATEIIQYLSTKNNIVDFITTDTIDNDISYLSSHGNEVIREGKTGYFFFSSYYGTRIMSRSESILQIRDQTQSEILTYFEECDASNKTLVRLYPSTSDEPLATTAASETGEETVAVKTATTKPTSIKDNENICNASFKESFNESVWENFKILIIHQDSINTSSEILSRAWFELPEFLRSYLISAEKQEPIAQTLNRTSDKVFQMVCNASVETRVTIVEPTEYPEEIQFSGDVINCSSIFEEFKKYLENSVSNTYHYTRLLNQRKYKEDYMEKVETLYKNMSSVLENVPQHKKCLTTADYLLGIVDQIVSVYQPLLDLQETQDISEALPLLSKSVNNYNAVQPVMANFSQFASDVYSGSGCGWYRTVASDEEHEFQNVLNSMQTITDYKSLANQYIDQIYSSYETMKSIYATKVYPTLQLVPRYLNKTVTKERLATKCNEPGFTKGLIDMAKSVSDLSISNKEFQHQAIPLKMKVVEGFSRLSQFTMPVLNHVNVKKLSFLTEIEACQNDVFDDLIQSFNVSFTEALSRLLSMNYQSFIVLTGQITENITTTANDLVERVSDLQGDLSLYRDSTKMDVSFFM